MGSLRNTVVRRLGRPVACREGVKLSGIKFRIRSPIPWKALVSRDEDLLRLFDLLLCAASYGRIPKGPIDKIAVLAQRCRGALQLDEGRFPGGISVRVYRTGNWDPTELREQLVNCVSFPGWLIALPEQHAMVVIEYDPVLDRLDKAVRDLTQLTDDSSDTGDPGEVGGEFLRRSGAIDSL